VSWPLVDENTYKDEKGVHERGSRDESSLAPLCSIRWVELRRWILGIVLLEIKGRTLPSGYRDSEQARCWRSIVIALHHFSFPCSISSRVGGSSNTVFSSGGRLSSLCLARPLSALRSHHPWCQSWLHRRCTPPSSSRPHLHNGCLGMAHGTNSHWLTPST
jgi:hypothetical protein